MNQRTSILLSLAILFALVGGTLLVASAHNPTQTIHAQPGDTVRVTCDTPSGEVRPKTHQHPTWMDNICPTIAAPTATATTVPPTATMVMPTQTPVTTTGWHVPGTHDGLNNHEHGDAPPQWVTDAPDKPFTQSRESHTGYKGVYDVSPGGVESYFIGHVISTETARAHGDHDYQLWLRDADTGAVFYYDGVLCFAEPCTAPTNERTVDDGSRPIVLGERSSTDGCETWYSDPGNIIADVGWTICQRYQAFDGTVLGGDGSFRTIDWIIPCDRLTGDARTALLDDCTVEFGVSRLSFLVNSREYETTGVNVTPIN